MDVCCLKRWLETRPFGIYLAGLEQHFFQQKLSALRFGTILQCGLSGWQFKEIFAAESQYIVQDLYRQDQVSIVADCLALPWDQQCIDTIIWPHGLDILQNIEQALAEIQRVLVPGGHLLLTGFNSFGYWRFFYGRNADLQQINLQSVSQVVAYMKQYGLFLEEGQFMGYGVPGCFGLTHRVVEQMGNRWWPHLAAIYGLVLVKRTIPLTLTQEKIMGLGGAFDLRLNEECA